MYGSKLLFHATVLTLWSFRGGVRIQGILQTTMRKQHGTNLIETNKICIEQIVPQPLEAL